MVDFDKRAVRAAFQERLSAELARAQKRAKDAVDGATHEENRAEGDKDMRATEASYVARGHSERVAEMEGALARLNALELLDFGPDSRIAVSALIELEHRGRRLHYFLLPTAGGERVQSAGVEIQALNSQSPLGAALLGLVEGDEAELPGRAAGEPARVYEVVRVR